MQPARIALVVLTLAAAGCAQVPTGPALEQARQQLQTASQDPQVPATAALDLRRAQESLQRAEQLDGYSGTSAEVRHHALLSQRYSQIALGHAQLAREQAVLEQQQKQRDQLLRLLREAQLDKARRQDGWLEEQLKALAVVETERGLVMTLGDVLFDSGRSELQTEANRIVLRLYHFLRLNPERRIRVEGYTDSQGDADANLLLSKARAEAVAQALIEMGMAAERIEVRGYGEAFPLAPNAASHGRALNRRVEVVFSDAHGKLSAERQPD